jgi:choline dehydrogenase-like flavoprotein
MVFDAIVIGSGFGGAVTACRLAEAGMSTLVLERGRRWNKATFPRREEDPWVWSHDHPEVENGWIDLRVFPGMSVVQGAGVGGGSLIYANVSCEAPKSAFDSGWPAGITYAALKPHYDRVADWMDVQFLPGSQLTERFKLVRDAAVATGFDDRSGRCRWQSTSIPVGPTKRTSLKAWSLRSYQRTSMELTKALACISAIATLVATLALGIHSTSIISMSPRTDTIPTSVRCI